MAGRLSGSAASKVPIVLAGLVLAFLVMLLFGGTELDRGLLMLLAGNVHPTLAQAAAALTAAADPLPLMVIAGIAAGLLLVRTGWQRALLIVAVAAGAQLLVLLLGDWTAPLRPGPADRLLPAHYPTFPDPAAANAAATALALAFLLVRHAPWRGLALFAAAAFALLAGTARLLLGQAWPSDVIGGWALGLCWTLLLLWLAGEDLDDGTPRPLRHSPPKGDSHGREPQDRDRPPE